MNLEEYRCNLWKRDDIEEEHFLVAVPEQHYTVGMDKMSFKQVEVVNVPSHTHFSKLPHYQKKTGKEEMVEKLREQLEYWQMQMAGKQANEMNAMSGVADEDFDGKSNAGSYYRYKKRDEACCRFLDALQENPRRSDTHIYHDHYSEVTYPNEL